MHLLPTAKHLSVSKPDPAVTKTVAAMVKVTEISSLGNVDPPVQLLPGSVAEGIDQTISKAVMEVQRRHGLLVAPAAVEMVTVAMVNRAGTALPHPVPLAELHLGNDSRTLLHHLQVASKTMVMEDIQAVDMALPVVVTLPLKAWVPLLVLAVVLGGLVLHQAWVLCSRLTMPMDLLPLPRRLAMLHLPQ